MHSCLGPSGKEFASVQTCGTGLLETIYGVHGEGIWKFLGITHINKSIKLTPHSMCRTAGRQFPPSRKATLQRGEQFLHGAVGTMQIRDADKDNRWVK